MFFFLKDPFYSNIPTVSTCSPVDSQSTNVHVMALQVASNSQIHDDPFHWRMYASAQKHEAIKLSTDILLLVLHYMGTSILLPNI